VRQRRHRRGDPPIECRSVEPRHLDVADDHVVGARCNARQRLFSIRRSIDGEPGIAERIGDGRRERCLVLDDERG
jgi:hypothetical protein